MPNPQNLIPQAHKLTVEEQSMGGKKSQQVQAEAKRRGEIWKELVNAEVTDEEMVQKLRELGVTEEHPTFERYIKATAMKDMMKNAKMQDVQKLDDELYGPLATKNELELSGEVSGITINVKKYNKEEDETQK